MALRFLWTPSGRVVVNQPVRGSTRLSYLCAVPCPPKFRGAVHDLSRPVRNWWPFWSVYDVTTTQCLGRISGTGDALISAELRLTSQHNPRPV